MPKKHSLSSHSSLKSRHHSVSISPCNHECSLTDMDISEGEKRERYDKYQITGDFEKDFLYLASLVGIETTVTHRVQFPTFSMENNEADRTKDDRNNLINQEPLKECEVKKESTASSSSLPYHKTKDRVRECLKVVEIGTEWEQYKEHIKEVYMRGWLVGYKVIALISRTLGDLDHVTLLKMCNVGLTDETLLCLGKCLQQSSSLKTLVLDGNGDVKSERFHVFLHEDNKLSLSNLSLRNCSLTETAVSYIAEVLTSNTTLLTLNLCFNHIGDRGAKHLAKSLQLNRTLLSLNVGSNDIRDEGVKHISEAISTFPLTHEQIVMRRKKLISLSEQKHNNTNVVLSNHVENDVHHHGHHDVHHHSHHDVHHHSHHDVHHHGHHDVHHDVHHHVTTKEKFSAKKSDSFNRSKSSMKMMEKSVSSDTVKVQKIARQKSAVVAKNEKSKSTLTHHSRSDETFGFIDPLLEDVIELGGQLWIPGNRSLINLNISRNNITKVGVEMLYAAVNCQGELARQQKRVNGVGLLRLCLKCRHFPASDPTYVALCNTMNTRDPLYKPSAMINPNDGTSLLVNTENNVVS